MASYKERVTEDLDRWIAAGHVSADHRAAILESIPDARRLDAAAALAWVGAVLLGVAVIAFVAANWDALPRLARFAMVLGIFAAGAGGAAWCAEKARPNTANGLLAFSALAFAAAIGLTGQIFDIAGEPRTALYASGVVAAALALAGRASGPAIAAILFFGIADFMIPGLFSGREGFALPWLLVAAPAGALLALRWRSPPLAHGAALGIIAGCFWLVARIEAHASVLLVISIVMAGLAAGGRWLREGGRAYGGVFYGWFAWGALWFFVGAGYAYSGHDLDLPHRLAWLLVAGGLVAAGRHDRHAQVTAAGVVGLLGAIAAILKDLGLDLKTAAAVFFAAAVLAALAGFALRRRAR
ncbi:MAG: DUF2157 domain-containing protein [Caulobacterales bacterium]